MAGYGFVPASRVLEYTPIASLLLAVLEESACQRHERAPVTVGRELGKHCLPSLSSFLPSHHPLASSASLAMMTLSDPQACKDESAIMVSKFRKSQTLSSSIANTYMRPDILVHCEHC